MELIQILTDHVNKYPFLMPQDAIKLIYQNEFGGGHMISDEKQSLIRIQTEVSKLTGDSLLSIDAIGNGFVRFPLGFIKTGQCTPEAVNRIFVASSSHRGEIIEFKKKLSYLQENLCEIPFCFTDKEFNTYLDTYIEAGCPMVSHTEQYRALYNPSYRVIRTEFLPELLP